MQDLSLKSGAKRALAYAVRTATAQGTGIDLYGWQGVIAWFHVGTWTDGTHVFSVEVSDASGSGYAAPSADDLILIGSDGTRAARGGGTGHTVNGASLDDAVYGIAYIGNKRYIRAVVTITGSPSTGAGADAVFQLGAPLHAGGQAV